MLCLADVAVPHGQDMEAFQTNMSDIALSLLPHMDYTSLHAVTQKGSNVCHTLASRGYGTTLSVILVALSEERTDGRCILTKAGVANLLNVCADTGRTVADCAH